MPIRGVASGHNDFQYAAVTVAVPLPWATAAWIFVPVYC